MKNKFSERTDPAAQQLASNVAQHHEILPVERVLRVVRFPLVARVQHGCRSSVLETWCFPGAWSFHGIGVASAPQKVTPFSKFHPHNLGSLCSFVAKKATRKSYSHGQPLSR